MKPHEHPIRVIFDTNAYSDLTRGRKEAIEVMRLSDRIGIPLIVYAELLAGYRHGNRFAKNQQDLQMFLRLPRVEIILPDEATADLYSLINTNLLTRGQPIPTNDIWIAALAMQYNEPLFTFDTHFARIEGLQVGSSADTLGL